MNVRRAAATALLLLCAGPLAAQEAANGLRGQLSGWLAYHDAPTGEGALGLRYIPSFSLSRKIGGGWSLDAEASADVYGTIQGPTWSGAGTSGTVKPYRAWVRLASSRFEARLGLQKINFGSALILRPLMWFDRIDPNDPLQLTDGVYALLVKYTFAGNANIWLWGLDGNGGTKGWETTPSQKTSPEYGGRIQIPALTGELAMTYHHRRQNTTGSLVPLPAGEKAHPAEDRLGLDGKWDVGPGVWFEAVLDRQDYALYPLRFQKFLNVGLDYTVSAGNGLYLMAEHLWVQSSSQAWASGAQRSFSAFTASYPIGLLDQIKGVVFHDWTTGDWYRLVTWTRTYDKWSFYFIGFWNPGRYQIFPGRPESSLFGGKGFQIMAVFNH